MTVRRAFLCLAAVLAFLPTAGRIRLPRNTVRIAFFPSPGWARIESDGSRKGVIPEWAEVLSRRCGWNVRWVHTIWSRAFDQLERGELDVIIGVASNRHRQDRYLFPSTPFMLFPSYLFVSAGSPAVAQGIGGLEGARIGLVNGFWHNNVLDSYLARKGLTAWTPVYFNTSAELARAFAAGRVDAALGDIMKSPAREHPVPLVAFPPLPLFTIASPLRPDLIPVIDYATTEVLLHEPQQIRGILDRNLPRPPSDRPVLDTTNDPDLGRAMVEVSRSYRADLSDDLEARMAGEFRLERFASFGLIVLSLVCIAGMGLFLQLYRRANAGMRARTNFLSLMSHEIRTPLNAVIGFAENLRRPDLSASGVAENAQALVGASKSLLSLVNDVLDLSKLEAHRMEVLDGTCDCARVFSDIRGMFAASFESKGVSFSCRAEGVPLLRFRESCLRQLLLNLVGNAYKFTAKGSVCCTAGVSAEGSGRVTFVLVVRDTGAGMAPDVLDSIFDPFAQAGNVVRDQFTQGTGLGLAIVQRLAEAAGGSVDVRSELGRGTVFVIRIPGLAVAPSADAASPAPSAVQPAAPECGRSVLVVDDVPLNRKVLQLHLTRMGVTDLRLASGGPEALEELEKSPAGLVLSDVWMPGMDGAELSRRIAARWPRIPVIAVTADTDAATSFDTSHFRAVLTKPITEDVLRHAMQASGFVFEETAASAGNEKGA